MDNEDKCDHCDELSADPFENVPEVDASIAWSCFHYDGPRSSVASFNSNLVWFSDPMGSLHRGRRRFLLYPLNKEEQKIEKLRHITFRVLVGSHTTWRNGKRLPSRSYVPRTISKWTWKMYCSLPWTRSHSNDSYWYKQRDPIGWFYYAK